MTRDKAYVDSNTFKVGLHSFRFYAVLTSAQNLAKLSSKQLSTSASAYRAHIAMTQTRTHPRLAARNNKNTFGWSQRSGLQGVNIECGEEQSPESVCRLSVAIIGFLPGDKSAFKVSVSWKSARLTLTLHVYVTRHTPHATRHTQELTGAELS